ncbi:MAG: class I SAM-dependent methyltransferase, partial [Deltaproteobacteria bacterium]
AFARRHGLLALDLVPDRWSTLAVLGFAQQVDPGPFRAARLATGATAGQALLVSRALAEKLAPLPSSPGPVALLRLARRLKRHAPTAMGFAAVSGLTVATPSAMERHALLRELFLDMATPIAAGQLGLWLLTLLAALDGGLLGAVGLLALHLQPLVALTGGPVEAGDLWPATLFMLPLQLWEWTMAMLSPVDGAERRAMVAARRPAYEQELAQGTPPFFEPRRTTCYVCGGERLLPGLETVDRLQHKPGRFTLEECQDCGHLFQNPRLSPAGLDFYYRDFYDGLSEAWLEAVFDLSPKSYLARASLAAGSPKRWLDVGGGYGHFCLMARERWPLAAFDCLDVGASVLEGKRRGWIDEAFQGFLPDLAGSLEGRYDVVSLSHCLEHTRDPRQELAAAHRVLAAEGQLLIEVPDPECRLRHLLGSRWMPYFQPQHQHLLSVGNLGRLLGEAGFEVTRVERGPAHVGSNVFFAAWLTLDGLSPPADLPWRPDGGATARARRTATLALGAPLLLAAALVDLALLPFKGLPGMSDAVRIVAKKRS